MHRHAIALAVALHAAPALAADVAWYLPFGTAGAGVGAAVAVLPNIDLRLEYAGGTLKHTHKAGDISYDARVKLSNLSLLADVYAGRASGWRISAGAVLAHNRVSATGRPSAAGTIEINGVNYAVPAGGTVDAEVVLADGLRPYVGIGWSRRASQAAGLGLRADIGVIYSRPRTRLSTSNVPGVNPADLAAEQRRLQDEADKYRLYPAVSLALSYRF